MKKKILFGLAFMLLACMLSVAISAKEYSPASGEELKTAIEEINSATEDAIINLAGDYTDYNSGYSIATQNKITFNLSGDAETACRIVITGDSKVVINLNGHSLTNETSKGGAEGCMFLIDDDAYLEINNGSISITDVAICFQDGSLKLQDVNLWAREETVWCQQGTCDGSGRAYYIDNCTLSGGDSGTNVYCMTADSYVTSCSIKGKLQFDSWHNHGEDDKISPARVENITVSNGQTINITTGNKYVIKNSALDVILPSGDGGGAGTLYFYDVTYNSITYDSSKPGYLHDYKSPTCDSAGSLTVYSIDVQAGTVDESYAEANPALGHELDLNNITDVTYESYVENGKYTTKCARCADGYATEDVGSASPLFTCLGFSSKENGTGGIALAYSVNNSAIEEYTSLTGKAVKYGVFAVAHDSLGDNAIMNTDGTVAGGVISQELTGNEANAFEIKITGFETAEQKEKQLAIGAYVSVTDEEGTKISYLQDKAPSQGESYYFASYNDICQ